MVGKKRRRAKPGTDLVVTRERENQALEMKLAGLSYAEIAKQMGYTRQAAWKAVWRRLNEFPAENAAELRKLENARYDKLQARAWLKMQQGDIKAMQIITSIMQQRARLNGLNAPERVELEGEFERWLVVIREIVPHEVFEQIAGRLAPQSSIETTGEEQGEGALAAEAAPTAAE